MTGLRVLRIAAFAILLALAFELSQRVAAASRQEQLEGLEFALGALALVFFIRALVTEYGRGPEANLQKDLQWGVGTGLVGTILWRLWT